MASSVRTYQKRGGKGSNSQNSNVLNTNKPLLPPTSASFYSGNVDAKDATTPPWRRRARKGLDAFEEAGDDDDDDSLNASSRGENEPRTVSHQPPTKALVKEFRKGAIQDREHLEGWVNSPAEFSESSAKCVPADWPLARQMRFAAWCQLLGLVCNWEGGYLWVSPTKSTLEQLAWIFDKQKQDANLSILASPLPAAPLARASSLATVEAKLAQLDLSTGSSFLSTDDEESKKAVENQDDMQTATTNARNRLRKWQVSASHNHQQAESTAIVAADLVMRRLSAGAFDRRSSLGAAQRRSSLAMGGDRGSDAFRPSLVNNARRSSTVSIVPGRATMRRTSIMQPVREEEVFEGVVKQQSQQGVATNWQQLDASGALRVILSFLSPSFLLLEVSQVSKRWNTVSLAAANALFAASTVNSRSTIGSSFLNASKFFKSFSQAKFLAEGAYKSVYRVYNPFTKQDEAVSVMDVNKIGKYGDVAIVAQEVNVSLVLSDLVTGGVCPNFIETSRVFQLNQSPPLAWTKSSNGAATATIKGQPFQYIRMEFCQGGDLEEHMKSYPGGVLPLEESRGVVFQMVYSLYAGRRTVKLRHYDIKCLNFFCKLLETDQDRTHIYSIGEDRLVKLPQANKIQVKLADYGTADLVEANLGKRIDVCHFTTLENTPMDFLLFPDAKQSYAADTFQLGLAVLHVLTGASPYEEILEHVKCPTALMDAVANVWEADGKDFDTLRCVLRDDDDNVLYHTLYRYLVLLGLGGGNADDEEKGQFHPSRSKVYEAIVSVLRDDVDVSARSLKAKNIKQARKQFAMDSAKFSLRTGSHHLIARARDRGRQLKMWDDLLLKCLDYSPEKRITAQSAVRSKAFEEWYTGIAPDPTEDDTFVYGEGLTKLDEEADIF